MTSITVRAVEELGLSRKDAERSKNMFALGLVSWMYDRPVEATLNWLERKFGDKPQIYDANVAAFKAGYNFGETAELFARPLRGEAGAAARPARTATSPAPRRSRAGSSRRRERSGLPLFYASYPITPASDILHELSRHKNFGVHTLQAEDEIAAVGVALGAAFAGHARRHRTSGPGMDLKAETIGLAVMLELPMVIVDVQRGGPSTGMPTKTEQADLLLAMFGRHGESPLPVVAARVARATASTPRSRPCRIAVEVPDAGDRAVRHVPRERLRAVAASRTLDDAARRSIRTSPRTPNAGDGVPGRTCATTNAGAAVGDPGHAGPRAPHRRPREGGRHRQHQLRRRRTTSA